MTQDDIRGDKSIPPRNLWDWKEFSFMRNLFRLICLWFGISVRMSSSSSFSSNEPPNERPPKDQDSGAVIPANDQDVR